LSNLLVNTRLGGALFPDLHGNRAAEVTYDPDTFVEDLERSLYFESPTFLAVHFTLVHWPYAWVDSEPRIRGTWEGSNIPGLYERAVRRLDQQFESLMSMLQRKGALENAIVVVLSDHGESLGELSSITDAAGDVVPLLGKREMYGHGTHLFAREQYDVLLAFRSYGETPVRVDAGASVTYPASLEDVAPTLLSMFDLKSHDPMDGRSLMQFLGATGKSATGDGSRRVRLLETEFNPAGIAVEERMTIRAISEATEFYRIDPDTDRVEIRYRDDKTYAAA
jgi:arylsulfatase A-like enzyme